MGQRKSALEDLVISAAFWKHKKVLLTGHTGFKGGWLALWLQQLGADVVGYSLAPPTVPNLYERASVGKHLLSVTGDVRDAELLATVMSKHRPDIVIHMAAQSLVLPSYADPATTYTTNVIGTVNMFEAVRKCDSVRVVVNVTSDKCYENRGDGRNFRETDPMGGFDPYSSSKACAELVTAAYRHSFFTRSDADVRALAVATARAGNVIGGGDWSVYRLVPDIMRAFLENHSATIRNPDSTRPWQHVLEPLSGYLTVAERMWHDGASYSGAWNFGPDDDDSWPVSRVADELARLWGNNATWKRDAEPRAAEAVLLNLDCSKAKSKLGWSPRLRLPTALAWTVEWYKNYSSGADMRALTEAQINSYQDGGKS